VVIIAKAPASVVRIGDVIEYRNKKENIKVVHRVISVEGEGADRKFITKGDNNKAPDADPVPSQAVIGKIVFNVPKIGLLSIAVKQMFLGG
jgi:signal peptidase I